MAISEQMAILKTGVKSWNDWRASHPEIIPDLTGAIFARANLKGINLSRTRLGLADFRWANLSESNLQAAHLGGAILIFANLSGANLTAAYLGKANLQAVNLAAADLSRANLVRANLHGVDLRAVTCAYVIQHQGSELGWFLRALEAKDKEQSVEDFFEHKRGQGTREFLTRLLTMRNFPMSIMAYWLPREITTTLSNIGTLESAGAATKHGVQTTDDFQFMRLAWEVPCGSVSPDGRWPILAKGGEYSPFFDNLHLCVDWLESGRRLKEFLAAKRLETQGSPDWTPWMNSHEDYFKPGLTFPARTASDFCPRILPRGCVFTASGQALLFRNREEAYGYLSGAFTRPFKIIVDAFVCSGDNSVSGSAANTYRTGLVNALPLPAKITDIEAQEIGRNCVMLARSIEVRDETSQNYSPSRRESTSLREFGSNIVKNEFTTASKLLNFASHAELLAKNFWGFSEDLLADLFGKLPTSYPRRDQGLDVRVLTLSEEDLVHEAIARHGPRRQLTKKTYIAHRRLELLCHIFEVHPEAIMAALDNSNSWTQLYRDIAADEISFCFGVASGRWDVRYVTGTKGAPNLPDPFAPLPVCPPGIIQNGQGSPLTKEDVEKLKAAGQWDYPIEIPWDGVLVDDADHANDIVRRMRDILAVIWKERADEVEQEACQILQVRELREYFSKPALFFADHLKRYSKSRRQAPIYWPLSTASSSYTLWLYYHRLTEGTLYTALNKYVIPKIDDTERQLKQLEMDLPKATGREGTKLRDAVQKTSAFLDELREFHDELQRVAGLPYKPDLNDGVLITASPLWKLFRLPRWRKDLQDCWERLKAGEYDWAHLAYAIWRGRVREACKSDRSIAVAHGLEELCEVAVKPAKKKRAKKVAVEQTVPGEEE